MLTLRMKRTPPFTFAVILLVAALALVAWVLTDNGGRLQSQKPKTQDIPPEFAVDARPLNLARDLAVWAASPETQDLAREAERVADHEVDLDFASALRRVSEVPPKPSAAAKGLEDRVRQMEIQIKKDQEHALELQQKAEKASDQDKANLEGESELADSQLALDEDEIADAKGDLAREGGDVQSKVVQAREQHEARENAQVPLTYGEAMRKISAAPNSFRAHAQEWFLLRSALGQIRGAQQEAVSTAARLSASHDNLEKQIQQEEAHKQTLTGEAALQAVHQLSGDQQTKTRKALEYFSEKRSLNDYQIY
jgi:hypothetical protein